jgi:hypothetical protein
MRILIIATRRSGGSNFGKWISMEKSFDYIYEPNITDDFTNNNIVVKIIFEICDVEKIKELSKKFDKVIIHTRTDVTKQAESLTYANVYHVYDRKYTIEPEFLEKNINQYHLIYDSFIKNNEMMNELNVGIHTTYEDIFSDDYDWKFLLNYLEIVNTKYIHFLNNKNKYRDNKKEKLI